MRAFVFTSTTSAFGRALAPPPGAPAAWITEDVGRSPRNIYGVTKVAAEDLCELVHRDHGLPVLILRTSRFFPEGDDRETSAPPTRTPTEGQRVPVPPRRHRRRGGRAPAGAGAGAGARLRALHRHRHDAVRPRGRGAAARPTRPRVLRGRFPEYEAVYAARGWTMFRSVGRVYDNARARADLGWAPRYDFRRRCDRLRTARTRAARWRSPSAPRATTPSRPGPTRPGGDTNRARG